MRALSPIISAMILIVAAVVGGMLAYQYFMNTLSTMVMKPHVTIDEATLYTLANMVYIKVSNMGGTPVKVNTINVLCNATTIIGSSSPDASLEPGKTTVFKVSLNPGVDVFACAKIYVALDYEAPNYGVQSTRPIEVTIVS